MAPADQPWVEKYRPRKISDVAHQEEAVATLSSALRSGNLPHLLLHGPPGTGKTTCALALVRELFGPTLRTSRVLELNASDERGISVVREKIKGFAAGAVSRVPAGAESADGEGGAPARPPPPFKVIILDEADSMTVDAQAALRRTMETHCKVTRFVILCNYVSRIIEPLASRCAKFRFRAVDGAALERRVAFVAEREGLVVSEEAMRALSEAARGDVRRALTALQGAARLGGGRVDTGAVRDVLGSVPQEAAECLLSAARSGGFDALQAAVLDAIAEGYPVQELLLTLQELLLQDDSIPELARADVLSAIAAADKALVDGADETLQLLGTLSVAQQAITISAS